MLLERKILRDPRFILICIVAVLYFAYWVAYAVHAYTTFRSGLDIATYAWNMYYDVTYPNVVHGLQLLAFYNHIAPEQLLILPIFYLFPSTLTLAVIQAFFIALTGIIVFLVARDLLRESIWPTFFGLAWFINVGIMGILDYDYHLEYALPLFFILAFYYYMKVDRKMLYVSLILLFGSLDAASLIGIPLGVGLLAKEYMDREKGDNQRKIRIRLALEILALTAVAIIAYNLIYYLLQYNYQNNYYPGIPVYFKADPVPLIPITQPAPLAPQFFENFQTSISSLSPFVVIGVAVGFLGFGIGILFDAIPGIIFGFPWLVTVLASGWTLSFFNHYYVFVVPGAFAASLLGVKKSQGMEGVLWRGIISGEVLRAFIISFSITLVLVLSITSALILAYTDGVPQFSENFLFQGNITQSTSDAQLYSALQLLPPNASLRTQPFIMPHVFKREYMDGAFDNDLAFAPQYVLVDFNENVSLVDTTNYSKFTTMSSMAVDGNYILYYRNGTAMLYKKVG